VIRVKELTCGYERTVLHSVSFSFAGNLCILGANGVGKSTLAKALCGLLPFEGEIAIDAKPLNAYSASERAKTITYIPPKLQSFDTYISVEEFVLMGRYPHKTALGGYSDEDMQRVAALLKETGLEPGHAVTALSSGQQQLLLIAQALMQESRIILFDEPTANLDPRHARDFYLALRRLPAKTQKIVITHDLHFARALGYPVLFLHEKHFRLYEEPQRFYTPENLEACYGVAFRADALGPEVHYG
jgi:iron complex transport system ATP-binding protein